MQQIDYLIIQSTNTSEAKDFDKEEIIKKHTSSLVEGGYNWNRPGLDYLILQDGTLQTIVDEDSPTTIDLWGISKGSSPLNGLAKHIGYVGGRTLKEVWGKDTRTEAQKQTLEAIVRFYILRFPAIVILGFNEIPAKKDQDNPGFEVTPWLEELEIPTRHIYKRIHKDMG